MIINTNQCGVEGARGGGGALGVRVNTMFLLISTFYLFYVIVSTKILNFFFLLTSVFLSF